MSRVGIGIDFGTTNSAAAVYTGESLHLIDLEQGSAIMPSATYIDKQLQTETGREAIEQYIADNTGRTVELVPEVIGEASLAISSSGSGSRQAPEMLTKKIYGQPLLDSGLQGRLFRGTKRLLGNKDIRRLMVFEHPFRLVALITPILLRIRSALIDYVGEVDAACVGHPVNFEGRDQYRNTLAFSRLGEAYRYAGIKSHRFYPEPIAAAVSFLHGNREAVGDHVLTVDFGGGTLDFCILRRIRGGSFGSQFQVMATHGISLGGDHIDRRIFRELLFPLFGKGERWKRRGEDRDIETLFPFEDYEDLLLNWAVTYLLNQNKYTTPVLDCIHQDGPAKFKFRRLRELIQHNYGYFVFQAIKSFKAELSFSEEAVLDIPEVDVEARLLRSDFEVLIGDLLNDVAIAVDDTVTKAALTHNDIDIVLRTGGSSLIPAVHRILDDRFPERVVDHDAFTSVAAGLAIANYYDLPAG